MPRNAGRTAMITPLLPTALLLLTMGKDVRALPAPVLDGVGTNHTEPTVLPLLFAPAQQTNGPSSGWHSINNSSAVAAAHCPGVCQSTSAQCASGYKSGLCPGPAQVQCCPEPTPSCGGQCQQNSLSCAGKYLTGLCPGGNSIQCCAAAPAPSPVPPDAPFGPDVSHYQGHVDWAKVKAAGAGFGIAKATEGLTYTDNQFQVNWAGMRSAGLKVRGAYHFGRPGSDAAKQVGDSPATGISLGEL